MFGLTLEKLFVVAVLAAVIIGPSRLPGYAARLAELVRGVRAFVDSTRTRTESELGVAIDPAQWHAGIRQYDPRHIVRQALDEPPPTAVDVPSRAVGRHDTWFGQ